MKIKVLFIASEFAPGMIPFAASIINSLAADERFEVFCICTCSKSKTYRGLISKHAQVSYIDYPISKPKKILYKFWPFKIINAIKKIRTKEHPDIIHFITGDFSLALYIRLYHKKNMCYTVHDLNPHEVQCPSIFLKLKQKIINTGYSVCMKSIKCLTTSSHIQCKRLIEIYPDKTIAFTPFPSLVTEAIRFGNDTVPEISNNQDYILFFGNVCEYKGIKHLIEAYSMMNCQNKLVIAGKGDEYQSKNPNIIRINRFIMDSEIKNLFERAIFIVYPYISATMSGVLSLSSYFKKNVLLSDIPFFLENPSALTTYYKAGNINDLKSKLSEMLQKNKIIDDDSFEKTYSTSVMTNAYYSFYKQAKT